MKKATRKNDSVKREALQLALDLIGDISRNQPNGKRKSRLNNLDLQKWRLKVDWRDANLAGADFEGTNLQYACLESANLQGANLKGTDLQNANLNNANLAGG